MESQAGSFGRDGSEELEEGFVRPMWLSTLSLDGRDDFFDGIQMTDLSSASASRAASGGGQSFRSLQKDSGSITAQQANGFLTNHDDKLEDSLVKAVREVNLQAIEVLLDHYLQLINLDGFYDNQSGGPIKPPTNFPPLVVAAHLGNYDVLKLFLLRGFRLEKPHDVLCKCSTCLEDEFKQSQKRLDIYRAYSDPMWVSLTCGDPFLAAFKLSQELKSLSRNEDEFEKDYLALSYQCRLFAVKLLDECKTAKEQRILLNFPVENPTEKDFATDNLGMVNCAILYRQKEFIAHPFCQHLLMSHVFGDVTRWRTSGALFRVAYVATQVLIYPFMAFLYFFAPFWSFSNKVKRPFVKFINHTTSFFIFLVLLAASSGQKFNIRFQQMPSPLEWIIFLWILGIAWSECKQVWHNGFTRYLSSGWNWMDIGMVVFILGAFLTWTAVMIVAKFITLDPFIHEVILSSADGMYAFGVVASFFRLIYLCQISRYLGLLQLSLSRMVCVIFQFAFISCVLLCSFSVAMTSLFSSSFEAYNMTRPVPNSSNDISLLLTKGYYSLPTTMVTLTWASFDMVGLDSLEVFEGQRLIEFWSAFLFTLYHTASMIVLLNMLIAMMSNSYQQVEDNIETEYKFARAQLWLEYIGDQVATLPPPMNLIPSPKSTLKFICKWANRCCGYPKQIPCLVQRQFRIYQQELDLVQKIQEYQSVVRDLVKRYWVRRRRQDAQKEPPDRLVTMAKLKDDVTDMLSEIRNILKSVKASKGHEKSVHSGGDEEPQLPEDDLQPTANGKPNNNARL